MSVFSAEDMARFRAEGAWGDLTLPEMFEATCARAPDRLGVIDPPNRADLLHDAPRRLTYGEMRDEVDRYAAILQDEGFGPGSVIATQLPNISELVLIYLAVWKIGAVLSPISMAYRAAEIRDLCKVATFDGYISVGRLRTHDFYGERIGALAPGVRKLGLGAALPQGVKRIDDAIPEGPVRPVPLDPDDLLAIFWTSGTEGVPKAVPKSHNNMMASSLGAWRLLNLPDGANILAPFPFVNAAAMGGLMMCWMRTAGAIVLHHPFDVDLFVEQLKTEDVGYTMVAPTVLAYLRDQTKDPALRSALHRLLAIGTGSAPPDPEVFDFFQSRFDVPVVNFFGSNEGAQMCSSSETVEDSRKRASFFPRTGDENWDPEGRTANGGTFRLVDPETGDVVTEPGAMGEMQLRGPALMPGYYVQGRIDRGKFLPGGYFPSGDLFQISDCGTLIRFHSRSRELIVRGGMKISPVELDNTLSSIPGVREVGVAAYSDPRMGEKVCAFVVLEPGHDLALSDVTAFCDRAGVAKFKWPERLEILDALPRTALSKLDRKALANRLASEGVTE